MARSDSAGPTTAENLEERFDAGEEVLDYFDLSRATRPNRAPRRVSLDMDPAMVAAIDAEAARADVNRQAIIKVWLRERLDLEAERRAARSVA